MAYKDVINPKIIPGIEVGRSKKAKGGSSRVASDKREAEVSRLHVPVRWQKVAKERWRQYGSQKEKQECLSQGSTPLPQRCGKW